MCWINPVLGFVYLCPVYLGIFICFWVDTKLLQAFQLFSYISCLAALLILLTLKIRSA